MAHAIPASAPLVLMVTTVNRSDEEKAARLFTEAGVTFNLVTYGLGTATRSILHYLGLGQTEKSVLLSTMPLEQSRVLLQELADRLLLNNAGRGMAFTLPVASVCGKETVNILTGSYQVESREPMELTFENRLLVAIANRGFADDVMAAARSVVQVGGTVLHGRGTGHGEAETFFGVMIHPEKELVLIVTPEEYSAEIMKAIASRAGTHTDAHAIVFSLPVVDAIGLPPLSEGQQSDNA